MDKLHIITLVFLMLTTNVSGQKLAGIVSDSLTQEVLPFATISIKDIDGKIIGGTLADDKGKFSLTIPKNTNWIEIGFMGYITITLSPPYTNNKGLKLLLKPNTTTLADVIVEGERTSKEFLIDRKVINFGADLQASGGTVLEAFEQLPELEVNPTSGELVLRGNSNVKILVNGKPSPLNPQDLLNQINANEVEKVEIITSPSARYQADGLSGIINIIMIDKVIKGFAGGINFNARTNPGYGLDFNLKSGFGKFNIQGSYGYRDNFYLNKNKNNRYFANAGEAQLSAMKSEFNGNVNTLNLKADWFINKNNDFSASYRQVKNEHNIDVFTYTFFNSAPTEQNTFLNNFHSHKTKVYNLNYRSRFNEKGDKYLDIDINLNQNDNRLPNTLYLEDILLRDNDLTFNNRILNIAADFLSPIGKNNHLELGTLYTFKEIDNQQIAVFSDRSIASAYNYEESTYAAYAIFKHQKGPMGLQLGLRGEQFNSNGFIDNYVVGVRREFFNLFPSVHLSYKKNEKYNYSLAYNRRISRPSLFHVNPLTTINNPQYRREGNPEINPEFTDNVEFGLQFNNKKWLVNNSIFYRHSTNLINRTFRLEEDVTVMSFQNGGKSHAFGMENTVSLDLTQKLNASLTTSISYLRANPNLEDQFFRDQYSYSFRTNFKYKFNKKLSGDLQFLYYGKSRRLNIEAAERNFINLALRYKLLKGKGIISLRFTDIYRGNIYKNTRVSNDIKEEMEWIGQTRAGIISFVYNFSKGDIKKRKSKTKHYRESGALE